MSKKADKDIYPLYEAGERGLKAYFNLLAATVSVQAQMLEAFAPATLLPEIYKDTAKKLEATSGVLEQLGKDYPKPAFAIKETVIDGKTADVTEERVLKKDFCDVLHFKRDTTRNDPKVLIVAAMSGHHATQFRDTITALLPNHDVYIVAWKNARDVPLAKGDFGFDDYVTHVEAAIQAVGPDTHVMAVSQSTVPVLAAAALLAAKKSPVKPLSMTLMGGPIDTRAAKTSVTEFVKGKDVQWFADHLIVEVPKNYAGAGRAVYPGFLQLAGLLAANPEAHIRAYSDLFNSLSKGDKKKAGEIKEFYNEYLSVCDLTEKFYLDTISKVFLKQELADGTMQVNGEKVAPEKITKTVLMTVEGTKDNIVSPGQTRAAHDLCKGLDADSHYHLLQKDADHYGLFSGKIWREEIMPRVAHMIRESAAQQGVKYDPMQGTTAAKKWTPPQTKKSRNPKPPRT